MNRFQIGLYGFYDEGKYIRDFREGIVGIEACMFENEEDVEKLLAESKARPFPVGIHFPLRAWTGRSSMRDALFLSRDDEVRRQAWDWIEDELAYASRLSPTYILFHYPKPVIFADKLDLRVWNFTDEREYVRESEYPYEEFTERSEALFAWLTAKSLEYGFTPVLEFDGLNRYVTESNIVVELLQKYPRVKVCLDTGRLFLQEKLDPSFDARSVIRKYGKYAELIHLWTFQYDGEMRHRHHPVLPDQKPEDGWAPIEDYLTIALEENPEVAIHFEHRSDRISDEELDRCYRWVNEIAMRGKTDGKL
ncbi:TIM barrel protein [Gorillibacterium massiliense]|uniref:TIM barrel protein n=1 Tax=Gorillibacterium massiliense TaxID=1280390 RepID=UPI0004AF7F51|nr:TIM barrel protein [Gorillibacterium massiliense]